MLEENSSNTTNFLCAKAEAVGKQLRLSSTEEMDLKNINPNNVGGVIAAIFNDLLIRKDLTEIQRPSPEFNELFSAIAKYGDEKMKTNIYEIFKDHILSQTSTLAKNAEYIFHLHSAMRILQSQGVIPSAMSLTYQDLLAKPTQEPTIPLAQSSPSELAPPAQPATTSAEELFLQAKKQAIEEIKIYQRQFWVASDRKVITEKLLKTITVNNQNDSASLLLLVNALNEYSDNIARDDLQHNKSISKYSPIGYRNSKDSRLQQILDNLRKQALVLISAYRTTDQKNTIEFIKSETIYLTNLLTNLNSQIAELAKINRNSAIQAISEDKEIHDLIGQIGNIPEETTDLYDYEQFLYKLYEKLVNHRKKIIPRNNSQKAFLYSLDRITNNIIWLACYISQYTSSEEFFQSRLSSLFEHKLAKRIKNNKALGQDKHIYILKDKLEKTVFAKLPQTTKDLLPALLFEIERCLHLTTKNQAKNLEFTAIKYDPEKGNFEVEIKFDLASDPSSQERKLKFTILKVGKSNELTTCLIEDLNKPRQKASDNTSDNSRCRWRDILTGELDKEGQNLAQQQEEVGCNC